MCKGEKSCDCGCKDQYNLDLGIPLTFGDGGYISKKIVQDLDQRLIKQFPDPKARQAIRDQAMGVIRQMAYGGLTNKESGSQALDYNPDSSVSNNFYDQGLSTNQVDTSIMEGTRKEKIKDFARTGAQATIGALTGVVDAAGSMAGIDTEPLTGKLSNLKFGEMTQSDLDKQQRANQIGQTVGATAATVAGGIATGGNPMIISRGADQAFQELGQVDPNSSTLNTISGAGQAGSQLYGALAGSGTQGGFTPEQLESGAGRLSSGQTQDLSKYLQATQGLSTATSLANGGPTNPPTINQLFQGVPSETVIEKNPTTGEELFYTNPNAGLPPKFDYKTFQRGVSFVESKDGKYMKNPNSSATGLYGQLYNEVKDLEDLKGKTRDDFAADTALQNKILELRVQGKIPGIPGIQESAETLYNEYSSQIPNFPYNVTEVGALVNFLGRQGTRNYLGRVLRDKENLATVFPNFYGENVTVPNKTPEQYITEFRTVRKYGGPISYQSGGPTDPPTTRKKLPTLYVDRNDPEGQKRYQAYEDSLLLHNNTIGSIKALQDAKTAKDWLNHNPNAFNPDSQEFKDHVAARKRLNSPVPRVRFDKFLDNPSSTYFTQEYYEPVQPVKYGINYTSPLTAPTTFKENNLPQRNLATPNLPRAYRFDDRPHYTTDNKGNKVLAGMNVWDEQAKSWKRRKPTSEEMQYFTPQMKNLGKVSFQNGGPTNPPSNLPKVQIGKYIPTWANPYNWGVEDYTDKYKTWDEAYAAAKKAGLTEIMWNKGPNPGRKNLEYAGTPRQEVGAYGIKGKPVHSSDLPIQINKYDALNENYLTGHISAGYVGRQPSLTNRTSVNKTSQGTNKRRDYKADQNLFVYDSRLNPENVRPGYNLVTNNCADAVCDALSLSDRDAIETPSGVVEKLLNSQEHPSLDVTGRTYGDYEKKLLSDKNILDNAKYWLGIASSPDNRNLSKLIIRAIQANLSDAGYELPKSRRAYRTDDFFGQFDGVFGDETKAALLDYQNKSKQPKDLGRVAFQNGGPTDPNLTALGEASVDNNYYNNINLGPAGPYSNAYVEDAVRFYYDNGQTKFAVNTGQDRRGNPLYTTTNLAGLERTVNSIEDENLRMAALGNMPGPVSYNQGNANLNLSPSAKRALGKESYYDREDIGSFGALMGRMNPLDVNPNTLKKQPVNTITLRGPSEPNPTPPGRGTKSCGPDGCFWQQAAGGPISYTYGGGLRRWFKENWTDVKTGEPCGRESASDSSRPYPYCRPANKVSSETPATIKHPKAKSRARAKTGPSKVTPIKRR